MKAKTLVIGLFSNRIDMLSCNGDRVIAARRLAFELEAETNKWIAGVLDLSKTVRTAAEELGAVKARVVVLYRSPTETAEYASSKSRSASEAKLAAIAGCTEALAYSPDEAVMESVVFGRDSGGAQPQTHSVVAADRDDCVSAIVQMVEQAGLHFGSATPIDSVIMHRLGSLALDDSKAQQGYLYIGEHRSFFVIASAGAILFARPVSVGVDAIISSLTRPIRTAASDVPIELSVDSAREILFHHGFAERNRIVHEQLKLVAGQLLPLVQPVMQRLIVELRQSLRFGLPEQLRQATKLWVSGPGCAIPGLVQVLSLELQSEVVGDERYASHDSRQPGGQGSELHDALSDGRTVLKLSLQPRELAKAHHVASMQRWLWTGAAAALTLVGWNAFECHKNLITARHEAERVAANAAESQSLREAADKLKLSLNAMDRLEAVISQETAASLSMHAYLLELSRLTPSSIRLTGLTLNEQDSAGGGSISGYVIENQQTTGRPPLEAFIDGLRASPMFDQVVLSNVQVSLLEGIKGQRFEARFKGVAVLRSPVQPALTSANKEATP